jgi:16S rRNA A1518/A1519 N6-dimethyltransferase RsmA/KsgA/DIM1 with predicted DNA glycosylase/AP lyase activity
MDRYKETFDTWNNIASIYQDKFMDLDVYNDTYDHICNAVTKPKAKLLDIGGGPGNITKYLLSKRPDFDIFGIGIVFYQEINSQLYELAQGQAMKVAVAG